MCWETHPGGITKTTMVFLTMFEHHNYGDITDEWWLVDEYSQYSVCFLLKKELFSIKLWRCNWL